MVELVFVEVKAAYQRFDGAVARVQRHKCTFHLGQLGNFPAAFCRFGHANHGARAQADVGRGLVGQARLGWLEPVARDFEHFAALAHGAQALGVGFNHHGRLHVAVVGVFVQHFVYRVFDLLRVFGQGDELFGPPVDLAALKVHDAAAQRLVGGFLLRAHYGGAHV